MFLLPLVHPWVVGAHTCRVFVRIPPSKALMVELSEVHVLAQISVLDGQKLRKNELPMRIFCNFFLGPNKSFGFCF